MKLIKYLALIVVALLVSTSSYTVGEGSWECLWGTGCTGGGNRIASFGTYDNDIIADITGSYCVPKGGAIHQCGTTNRTTTYESGYAVIVPVYITSCHVWVFDDSANMVTTDKIILQFRYIEPDGDATFTGNTFTIKDDADDCGSDTNCVKGDGAGGNEAMVALWTVNGVISANSYFHVNILGTSVAAGAYDLGIVINCSY